MKHIAKILFVLTFLTSMSKLYSQKIYLDSLWNETNKQNASYYRQVDTISNNQFYVRDYFINGQIQMEGHYSSLIKEIEEGQFLWFNIKGNKVKECYYNRGKLDGTFKKWHDNGKLNIIGKYKLDKQDSTWIWIDSKGDTLAVESYLFGKKDGLWTTYYSNGKRKGSFSVNNDKFAGYAIAWDSTGALKVEVQLDSKMKNGYVKICYPNGNTLGEGNFEDGKPSGEWIAYFSNGNIKGKGLVEKGYKIGQWYYYYEDGSLDKIIIFDKKSKEKLDFNLQSIKAIFNGS